MQGAIRMRAMYPADGEDEFAAHCLDGVLASFQMHSGHIETAVFRVDGDHAGDVAVGDGDVGIVRQQSFFLPEYVGIEKGHAWS